MLKKIAVVLFALMMLQGAVAAEKVAGVDLILNIV